MSTGEVPVVKSKLPIRLTLRHATGEMPLRISMAFWSLAASSCSYTGSVLANVVRVEHILAVKNDVFPFDGADNFTTGTSPVDIEALAERYENPDFWRRSLQEADDDGPAY